MILISDLVLFENGNSIKTLPSSDVQRSKRSELYKIINNPDGTVDYFLNQDILNEILEPFCATKDGEKEFVCEDEEQSLYLSSVFYGKKR